MALALHGIGVSFGAARQPKIGLGGAARRPEIGLSGAARQPEIEQTGHIAALSEVSLTVPDGSVVGIIGPNGAGKTTLLNAVCGLVALETGTMTLDGAPLRPRPDRLTRVGIARTLQGIGLFDSLTVLENVLTGARDTTRDERARRARGWALLEEMALSPYGLRLPATLPYALRKKVALARALASRPHLLLLDEPAGGLAADEVDALAHFVVGLPRRGDGACSVLLVEHDLAFVGRVCDEVVALDLGRVLATGTPQRVRADPAVAASYLGAGPDPGAQP